MFRRFIEPLLLDALSYMPITLLRGARQTGKTTLMKEISKKQGSSYLTFDHLPNLVAAKNDPVGFISRLEKPIILDEIQRVPELFLPIKADVDEHRIPGRYLLTGSADPLLIPQLADSLAGRMRLLNLWPLSQEEIHNHFSRFLENVFDKKQLPIGRKTACTKELLFTLVAEGGFPTPLQMDSEKQRAHWYNDYTSLVLQKDVLELARIDHITQIPQLLMLLASRVGGLLNMEELARSLKLSSVTLNRYIDLLRTLFLIQMIPAWSGNLGKRLVKSPKVYLVDTGLQLFMLNVDIARLKQDPHLFGNVLENFVVLELIKQLSWSEKRIEIFHYRDYSQNEVDIILEGPGGDLVAIEIKSSESLSQEDFKGLKKFKELVGDKLLHGILLYPGSTHLPFGDRFTALPITSLWKNHD